MNFSEISPCVHRVARFKHSITNKHVLKSSYDYRIAFVEDGEFIMLIDDKSFLCKKNTIIFWLPGSWYTLKQIKDPNYSMISVFFDFDTSRAGMEIPFSPPTKEVFDDILVGDIISFEDYTEFNSAFTVHNCASIGLRFKDMYQEYTMRKINYKHYINAQFSLLLTELLRRLKLSEGSHTKRAATADKVIAYIHKNIERQLNCTQLAEELHYNPKYINHIMKDATGFSLHDYIQKVKISHAVEMLENSELPVSEIAHLLGFSDASHFTKVFRSKTGYTPMQIRNSGSSVSTF
jgi:AraC-like DNA-binding protein